jgi:cation:H+ antiporter
VVHVVLLLVCAVVIYLACEWFVNAIEWLGAHLSVGAVAVGTILAAAGTALPESIVTLVAVTFGSHRNGADIGVGAAMGGPLVVGTIAYGVTGAALLLRSRARARATAPVEARISADPGAQPAVLPRRDTARLAKDQTWFLIIFAVKVALGLVAFAIKPWLGLLFFATYGVYFWREMHADGEDANGVDLEPLKLQPRRPTSARWAVIAQTLVTLAIIFGASQLFVRQLEWAGPALGLPAVVVALLLSPSRPSFPRSSMRSSGSGRARPTSRSPTSGAMMIQATVPSGIGILFTPWKFDAALILAGVATAAAISYLLWLLRTGRLTAARLTAAAGFYGAFAIGLAFV